MRDPTKNPGQDICRGYLFVLVFGFERFCSSASGIALFVGALVSLKSVSVTNKKPGARPGYLLVAGAGFEPAT
ncbi:MAG: hypothetical protein VX374_01755, partial [Pseudomonadota bacterium]|nr:hypothetical protein [Pseudomonadota bacterium]